VGNIIVIRKRIKTLMNEKLDMKIILDIADCNYECQG
jgi:hypothetical protein